METYYISQTYAQKTYISFANGRFTPLQNLNLIDKITDKKLNAFIQLKEMKIHPSKSLL